MSLQLPATLILQFVWIRFHLSIICQLIGEKVKSFSFTILLFLMVLVGNAGSSDDFDVLIIIKVPFLVGQSDLISIPLRQARHYLHLPWDAPLTITDI
jgi:hypothetical protein